MEGSSSRGKPSTKKRKKTVIDWLSREDADCIADADLLRLDLITSLDSRIEKCIQPAMMLTYKCLDFNSILKSVQGNMTNRPGPYNKAILAVHGECEIKEIVKYLASMDIFKSSPDHQMDVRLATTFLQRIKDLVADTIWGDHYSSIGRNVLRLITGPNQGKYLQDVTEEKIVSFTVRPAERDSFELEPSFSATVESASSYNVVLDEARLFKHFMSNAEVYSQVGIEACAILDFCWSLGGSEAIAETYFGIMKNQRKDGGQNHETLEMRTMIDFTVSMPSHIPNTIKDIANLYLAGDSKKGLKKHRQPVFFDKKERSIGKYIVSKVVDKLAAQKPKYSFLK